jgi:peptide/nickel transport system substrate-binding protein
MLTSFKQIVRASARLGTAALLMSAAVHAHSQEVTRGGSLNVLSITAINSLNPAIQSGVATGVPASQLFASLLQADAKWQFHPYLADSWSVSPDGLTYTFKLNKDAKFHDGKPITSADVAFSAETVKANHPFGPAMLAALDKVETPDAHTAVFRLRQPNPALLLACSTPALMPILPKHVYSEGPIRQNPKNNAPVGSGPFRFVEYKPGEYLTLARFDGYFRKGKPYLDKITYSIVPDRAAAALAMQRGDIQFVAFAPFRIADVDRLAADPKLTVTRSGYDGVGSLNWLAFNTRQGPLANVKVRQAISYAIDRDFISQKLQRGRSQPAWGPVHPASPFYSKTLDPYKLDLARANKLLDEAGYPKKADGTRFALRLDFLPGAPDTSQLVAEYLRPQLAKVGIQAQLRPSPDFPTWSQRIASWDFDMTTDSVFNWGDPVIGVARTYQSGNIKKGVIWSNTQGYANAEVDKILAEAASETDATKRAVLYDRFQKILNSEVPVAWLNTAPVSSVANKKLRGLPDSIWGAFAPFDEVYWAK